MEARLIALLLGILSILAPGATASARPAKVEGVFYLKVRAAPGFDAAELGTLAAGARVSIIEETGRWARVRLPNNTTGYVSRKYLVLLDAPTTGAPLKNGPADPAVQTPEPAPQPETRSVVQAAPQPEVPADRAARAQHPASTDRPDAAADRELPGPTTPAPALALVPRQPDPWTTAHVEEVRNALQDLAAGQDRLAGLIESRIVPATGRVDPAAGRADTAAGRADPATGRADPAAGRADTTLWDAILAVPTRQVAFWLAVGYLIGWSTTMLFGRWRQRRHRHRVRI